jgi:eukaryotic-like serine/threonine-protein kinase
LEILESVLEFSGSFWEPAMSAQNQHIYEFGHFRLDASKGVLLKDGKPLKLFPKEFATLLALVERSGEVLDKDELMQRVWPDSMVEEGNLTTNISHLRRVLGETPGQHQYIVTIPGKGYRFVAEVRPVFEELVVPERMSMTVENEEVASQSQRRRTVIVLALLLLGSMTVFGIRKFVIHREAKAGQQSIAFNEFSVARLTNSGKAKKAAISPDGRYLVHVSEDRNGQSLWVTQVEITSASQQIIAAKSVEYWGLTFSPDGNYIYCVVWENNSGLASLYQVPVLGGVAKKLPINPDSPISFSSDGKQMAFVVVGSSGSRLMISSSDGTGVREIARRHQPDYFRAIHDAPVWSPDDKVIAIVLNVNDAVGRHEVILAVNLADHTERIVTSQRWWSIRNAAWLPDGAGLLAVVSENASLPAQVCHFSFAEGGARKLTNDLNHYDGINLTADGRAFVTVQSNVVSSIWVVPLESASNHQVVFDDSHARQIASEVGEVSDVAWAAGDRIIYVSRASGSANLWMTRPDDSRPTQLTTDAQILGGAALSPNGRFIVFASDRSGGLNIWRADSDGSDLKQLTDGGGDVFPHFSPDGQWVVFQRGSGPVYQTLWKVSVDGGAAIKMTDARVQKPRVSPDGKLVGYYYLDPDVPGEARWSLGVVPFAGGPRLKSFNFLPVGSARIVRWTVDSKSLAYLENHEGSSNIWIRSLAGGPPRQLTNFKTSQIRSFDWAPDGQALVVVREVETSDVVLMGETRLSASASGQ